MRSFQRPGLLSDTKYGEPVNRDFLVEAGNGVENELFAEVFGDGSVYYYTGNISGDTIVRVRGLGARRGLRWSIVRPASSTGLSALVPTNDDFTQLAIMNAGDWIECAFNGTRWVVVALGTGAVDPF